MTDEQTILAAGMKIVTRAEFEAATDVPAGNNRKVVAAIHGAFVIYDPTDDGDRTWLLVDDDRSLLVRETAQHLREQETEPDQPSLF
jgi:hypothetical protein